MAITTLAGVLAGLRPPEIIQKTGATVENNSHPGSMFYDNQNPPAAAVPSPGVNGAALTTYAGQVHFTNPGSGNTYLAGWRAYGVYTNVLNNDATLMLCDRLWHNSGLSLTSTSLQGITSGAMPARDNDGSTNGVGLMVGCEVTAATGAGTPVITLTYTNQAGTGSKTSTVQAIASSNLNTFYQFPLAAGDTGVRSIEGYQQNATWTSGSVSLVVYRVLALMTVSQMYGAAIDSITGGHVRLYDNTVPFFLRFMSNLAGNFSQGGQVLYAQG